MPNNAQTFYAKVENRHIDDQVRKAIGACIMVMDGKEVSITIKEVKSTRSQKQNRYYWGVVVKMIHQLFLDTGNDATAEEVHDFLKQEVGGIHKELYAPDGKVRTITGSSATQSTIDFEDYMQKCRAWAARWDVFIPLPNETDFTY